MINIHFDEAKQLLHEGDVLLFKGRHFFSYFIKRASHSKYSHVGLASWHNGDKGIWEIMEFRGFRGGRTVSLEQIVKQKPGVIDVYRPSPQIISLECDEKTHDIITTTKECNYKNVTHRMRQLTGLPYGWKRIWWFMQWYIPILRLIYNVNDVIEDEVGEIVFPVCSTSVAHAFSFDDFDLIKNRADEWTQPGDIALSTSLNYLFTLV